MYSRKQRKFIPTTQGSEFDACFAANGNCIQESQKFPLQQEGGIIDNNTNLFRSPGKSDVELVMQERMDNACYVSRFTA
jgi:hypothetical protein